MPFFVEHPVPVALAPYVLGITGFEEGGIAPIVRRELPVVFYPLIIVLGHGYRQHTIERIDELDRSFAAGITTAPADIGTDGWSVCVQVNLTPVGAWRLLQRDLSVLAENIVSLEDLLGPEARDFEDKLTETNDWQVRLHDVVRFLESRILGSPEPDSRVQAALQMVSHQHGNVRIDALAKALNCSRKHLASLFNRHVGATAKTVCRIARLQHTLTMLGQSSGKTLAEIAYNAGFTDQAHMNHDFANMTGNTPSAFWANPVTVYTAR